VIGWSLRSYLEVFTQNLELVSDGNILACVRSSIVRELTRNLKGGLQEYKLSEQRTQLALSLLTACSETRTLLVLPLAPQAAMLDVLNLWRNIAN
jgi:hypothetical protein